MHTLMKTSLIINNENLPTKGHKFVITNTRSFREKVFWKKRLDLKGFL